MQILLTGDEIITATERWKEIEEENTSFLDNFTVEVLGKYLSYNSNKDEKGFIRSTQICRLPR